MSIWKSPVLYFGLLLFAAVTFALAAPFILDWNAYKPRLEAYGQKLTGRQVKIDGDVEVRLFPVPRLEADDVRVFNVGSNSTVLGAADKVTVEVTLGSLINGNLVVQAVNFESPVINLTRDADGAMNFMLQPDEDLRASSLLRQVSLSNITIHNGTFVLRDEGKVVERTISNVDATLSAPSIEGPWKVGGSAFSGGRSFAFNFTSALIEEAKPFRFGLRLSPNDPVLPQVFLDGKVSEGALTGTIKGEAVDIAGAKSSQENSFSNLNMLAKVEANFNKLSLTEIKVTPRKSTDGSTLIEGEITADYAQAGGTGTIVNSRFDAPRFNLGGAEGLTASYLMERVGTVLAEIPETWRVNAAVNVASLTLPDGIIEGVEFSADVDRNALKVRRLAAKLPGRSQILFRGVAFPNGIVTDLAGEVSLESGDFRQFATWWAPEWKDDVATYWKGNRGRLKAEGSVQWSEGRVSLKDFTFDIDSLRGVGNLSFQAAGQGNSDINLVVPTLNLDTYLQPPAGGKKANVFDLLKRFAAGKAKVERHVELLAERLTLNGTVMERVETDFVSGPAGLSIRKATVASIGGASLAIDGEVLTQGDAPQGLIKSQMSAKTLRGVIALAGYDVKGRQAAFLDAMGETNMHADVTFSPKEGEAHARYALRGGARQLIFEATGDVTTPKAQGATAATAATADIKLSGLEAAQLMRLIGVEPRAVASGTLDLAVRLSGDDVKGFATDATVRALGLEAGFQGNVRDPLALKGASGEITLKGSDVELLTASLGLPLDLPASRAVDVTGTVSTVAKGHEIAFKGDVFGGAFDGQARALLDTPLSLDIATPSVSLADVISVLQMQWDGTPLQATHRLADVEESLLDADIWLRPEVLTLAPGLTFKESVIGLRTEKNKRSLSLHATLEGQKALKINAVSRLEGTSQTMEFELEGPVPLAQLFAGEAGASVEGQMDVTVKARGAGRNLLALLGSMKGSGTFSSGDVTWKSSDLPGFVAGIATLRDDASLKSAMALLQEGAGTVFGAATGGVSIDNGKVSFAPIKQNISGAEASLKLSGDLTEQTVGAEIALQLVEPANAPAIGLIAAGQVGAVRRQTRTSTLASMLGFGLLARDLAEMERLQAEQERQAKEEAAQIKQDEERFEAYQAQRAELRQRQRELRVHQQMRELAAKKREADLAKVLALANATRKDELAKFRQQLNVHRVTANGGKSKPVRVKGILPPELFDLPDLANP